MGETGPQGLQGPQGATGPSGPKGDDGVSPTISVSKSGKITTITIVDAEGTHTATINDGADGSGTGDMLARDVRRRRQRHRGRRRKIGRAIAKLLRQSSGHAQRARVGAE